MKARELRDMIARGKQRTTMSASTLRFLAEAGQVSEGPAKRAESKRKVSRRAVAIRKAGSYRGTLTALPEGRTATSDAVVVPLFAEYRRRPLVARVEVREQSDTDQIVIRGSAIVYGQPYKVVDKFGEFEERIHAGAASDLLARGVDCRFLFNHDGLPLARTA